MAFVLSDNLKAFVNTSFLLLLCFFLTSHIRSPTTSFHVTSTQTAKPPGCAGLHKLKDHHSKCLYIKSHHPCLSQGYVNYLQLYYCLCGSHPPFGYVLLALWLLILFYLLGNTASQYFCSSVENLSRVLNLSPAIAGVTLLSLGNGSPDVLASIVSFRSGSGEVGLSSVLGGAFFVSCVVVGIINLSAGSSPRAAAVRIDRSSFIRDVCFFVVVLSSLFAILLVGRINIWGAMAFTSLYFVYVSIVSVTHFCGEKYEDLAMPILEKEELNDPVTSAKEAWPEGEEEEPQDSASSLMLNSTASQYLKCFLYLMDMPLYLPRRLTIPDVSEERWSRTYAVTSATLAPIFVAALWNSKRGSKESFTIYLYGGLVGIVLGLIALHTTMKESPPKKFLFPWLAGGFLMSVLWTYIIAEELVGLLVSLGFIFGVSPAILGLTVLAWGNSIGDLIANVAMATSGGQDGAQIAMSGCYAGPIFNTLAGLGLSLVVSAWAVHPDSFVIPVGSALFEILGFMIGGLLWALVMLPRKGMKLDKVVGVGLLVIYFCFLSLRLSQSLVLVQVV
ncbi:cation/calcium exchanger 1-like [Musa acuminata AAA Group]|uniref:cation/calcium exchanger 1-like n=1 Tax=Musa acuminata AAA Group TaxID=214697 RepID=UPI0031DC308F